MCFGVLRKKLMRLGASIVPVMSRCTNRGLLWFLLVGFAANSQAGPIDVPSTLYIEGNSDYIDLDWDCEAGAYPECEFQQNGNTLETTRSAHESTRVTLTPGVKKFRILQCWLRKSGLVYYRQYCSYSAEQSVIVYSTPSSSPKPSAPSINTSGSYTVSWSSTPHTTKYKLYERYNNGSWGRISYGSSRSQARTGRSPGTYDYRVKSCLDDSHCADYSAIRTVNVKKPNTAPTITLPSHSGSGSYSVSWSSESYATSYTLQQKTGSGSWHTVQNSSLRSKSFSGLADNRYSYRVRAANPVGYTAFSGSKTIDVAHKPNISSIDVPSGPTDGVFSVTWPKPLENVTQYQFEIKKGSNSWGSHTGLSGNAKSLALSGGTYHFRVRAYNQVGGFPNYSEWQASGAVEVSEPSVHPDLQLPEHSVDGSYSISWNATSNTSTYELQERVGSGSWASIQNTSARSRSVSGHSNNTYQYRVLSCNRIGCSSASPAKRINVAHAPTLTSPIYLPSGATDGNFTISWHKANGSVTEYRVERQKNAGEWTGLTRTSDLSLPLAGLGAGSYHFRYQACKTVNGYRNCSPWRISGAITVEKPQAVPVLTLPASNGTGSYNITWGSVDNITEYRLQQRRVGDSWSTIQNNSNRATSISDQSNGQYQYQIRACNAIGCTGYSSVKTINVARDSGAPQSIEVEPAGTVKALSDKVISTGVYSITWSPPSANGSANRYQLEQKSDNDWSLIYDGSALTSNANNSSGTYSYRVRAGHTTGDFTHWSSWKALSLPVQVLKVPSPLDEDTVSAEPSGSGGISVSWVNPEPSEDNIVFNVLYQTTAENQWHPLYDGAETHAVLASIGDSAKYNFRVKACNRVSGLERCTGYVKIPLPVGKPMGTLTLSLPATSNSGDYTVQWNDNLTDVNYYMLSDSGDEAQVNASSRYFSGKTSGQYTYTVKACNNYGCAKASTAKTIKIAVTPGTPSFEPLPELTDGNYTVRWSNGSGEFSSLRLYQQRGSEGWTPVDDIEGTYHAFSGLAAGTYRYKIKACMKTGDYTSCSSFDTSDNVQVAAPTQAPDNITLPEFDEDGAYTLSWDATENPQTYQIQERVNDGAWVDVVRSGQDKSRTEQSFVGRESNQYQYRVASCNNIGCSQASGVHSIQVVIKPATPDFLSATQHYSNGKTQLEWQAVGSDTTYEVQQRISGGAWQSMPAQTQTSVTWPTAISQPGGYQYRVRACRVSSVHTACSPWRLSDTIAYKKPTDAPVLSVPFFAAAGAYTASWNSVSRAVYYKLEENNQLLPDVGGTEQSFNGDQAKADGFYTYRVSACNVLGCSEFSQTHTVLVAHNSNNDGTDNSDSDSGDSGASDGSGDSGSSDQEGAVIMESGTTVGPPDAAPTSLPVGATQGSFRVNESGAATYSIPLVVPQGTAGVTPKITFEYSSQAGVGLMGQGWSVGGLSRIQRCRQTTSQDGQSRPITWTSQDRLCLDGQRLIQTSSGEYGSGGTTYKTEIDSYIEVTAKNGGMSNTSGYFEVKAKDGSVRVYGATEDSRLAGTEGTLTWAQSEFRDSVGNRISFSYAGGAQSGYRIDEIEYAYPSLSGGEGNAKIQFTYEDNEYSASLISAPGRYIAGSRYSDTKRLKTVVISNRVAGVEGEYRRYNLTYQDKTAIKTDYISRLSSIQECVQTNCLKKTQFSWTGLSTVTVDSLQKPEYRQPVETFEKQQAFAGKAAPPISLSNNSQVITYQYLDVDGNSKQDLAWIQYNIDDPSRQSIYYATMKADGSGYNDPTYLAQLSVDLTGSHTELSLASIDYNADGRGDLVSRVQNASGDVNWAVYRAEPNANGSGWSLALMPFTQLPFGINEITFGDLNGDGLADAYYFQNDQVHVYYLKPAGVAPDGTYANRYYQYGDTPESYSLSGLPEIGPGEGYGAPYWQASSMLSGVGDFNGDGSVDVIIRVNEMHIKPHTNSPEPGPVSVAARLMAFSIENGHMKFISQLPATYDIDRAVDINSDGLTDILFNASGKWRYALNKGNSWEPLVELQGIPDYADSRTLMVADFNRDSYQDIVFADPNKGLQAYFWNGSSFAPTGKQVSDPWGPYANDNSQYLVADLDGDGWQDFMRFDPAASKWILVFADHQGKLSPNLMTGILDGVGHQVAIDYDMLTHSSHYSRVDVGDSVAEELEETCTDRPVAANATVEYCYKPIQYSLDTSDFYASLNAPFSSLPEGNDHLDNSGTPVLELYTPMPVVTDTIRTSPSQGDPDADAKVSYYYDQLKFQASGRGALGFRRLMSVDEQSGIVTETTYRQDWPFVGSPLKTVTRAMAEDGSLTEGAILSESVNKWKLKESTGTSGTHYYQTYVKNTEETQYDLDNDGATQGSVLMSVATHTVQDEYGNPTSISVVTKNGSKEHVKTTVNTYGGAGGGAKLGRLSRSEVTTTSVQGASEMRTASFTYYSSGPKQGLLKTQVLQPNSNKALTKTYHYDSFGNRQQVTMAGADGENRKGDLSIYSNGRYLQTVVNALGYTTKDVQARNIFGQPTQIKNIHGTVTSIKYDDFGREYQRSDATGAWTWSAQRYCSDGILCPATAVYRVEQKAAGGSQGYTYYDVLGRPVRKAKRAFAGNWALTDTQYNRQGGVRKVSNPYKSSTPGTASAQSWTVSEYDRLGRTTRMLQPNGQVGTSTQYNGFITTTTNALGQTKTEEKDMLGQLVKVTDTLGGSIAYTYNTQGSLIQATTTAPAGESVNPVTVRICYDELGNKKAMFDPDKGGFNGAGNEQCSVINPVDPPTGWWGYQYNSLGELVTQIDAKRQIQSFTYDKLGRKSSRTDYNSDGTVYNYTRWGYDTGKSVDADTSQNNTDPGSWGNLTYVTQSKSITDEDAANDNTYSNDNYSKIYTYDSYGRSKGTITFYPGGSTGYITGVSYDSIGRPYVERDGMQGLVMPNSGIHRRYNSYGYRTELIDLASGDVLHRVIARDARGNITEEERANGYTTEYQYDPYFGRLTHQSATAGSGLFSIQDISYHWDDVGNLKWRYNQSAKQDQSGRKDLKESFCYDELNRLIKSHLGTTSGSCHLAASAQDTLYDALGNITYKDGVGTYEYGDNAGPHAVTQAGGTGYTYDANGNQINSSDGRQLKYTPFDKPFEISKSDHTTTFAYGPDRARYQRTDTRMVNGIEETTTTTYLGNIERIETEGENTITWRRTVGGAVYITQTDHSYNVQGDTDKSFIYKDHLGSTDVITDKTGGIRQSMSFDAWGQRRNAASWSPITHAAQQLFDTTVTNQGFTGHEQLDEMGLVHMNGRIYDPTLGRFLQADTHIDGITSVQGYNRYSYVHNNPLNATDPSGFSLESLYKFDMKISGRWATHKFLANNAPELAGVIQVGLAFIPYVGAAVSAHFAFDQSFFATGCFGPAIRSGLISYATASAFSAVGGAFGPVTSARSFGSLMAQGVAHGVVGGISAELQGGKFERGFVAAGIGFAAGAVGKGWATEAQFATAVIAGGTASELTGGKFANGAVTSAFGFIFNHAAHSGQQNGATNSAQSQGNNPLSVVGDVIGKIWALPNTIIGAIYGGVGHVVGEIGYALGLYDVSPSITFGNNAIQFLDNPFTLRGTAITLGNTVSYGRGSSPSKYGAYGDPTVNIGLHEQAHTYQYQVLGPLFLPLYLGSQAVSESGLNAFENAAQNYGRGSGEWWPQ